ncbi:MAG: hypothetical protein SVS85_01980, partial [Candidatus Nanohaloarchaea archaeon]|nr:hypothetical protein [Candidatus Nanohaloarchaea archaeon]
MDSEELPLEALEGAEDLNFEGIFSKEMVDSWTPSEDIDWSQEIQVSGEEREALGDAATQFYYSNISHLMLCGRLLENGRDMRTKKLALFLAFSKMRNIEVFGRYLGKVSAEAEVAPYTKEYFSKMSENDLGILLPDMGVLGGTVGYGVLDFLKDAGDPLFAEIAEKVGEQKRENEEVLVDYLQDALSQTSEEELDKIHDQASFYRDRSEKIVLYHGDLFKTLG